LVDLEGSDISCYIKRLNQDFIRLYALNMINGCRRHWKQTIPSILQ
jgi:hypothetical protein